MLREEKVSIIVLQQHLRRRFDRNMATHACSHSSTHARSLDRPLCRPRAREPRRVQRAIHEFASSSQASQHQAPYLCGRETTRHAHRNAQVRGLLGRRPHHVRVRQSGAFRCACVSVFTPKVWLTTHVYKWQQSGCSCCGVTHAIMDLASFADKCSDWGASLTAAW